MVVGLGASAGGLEAVKKLLAVLPADTGMAFVLIQHLDPTHKSMLVELLARDTAMNVFQAADGMSIQPNCLYVIPPQADLSVHDGLLRLSQPPVRLGAHLPFDFFLNSLADNYGKRAVCLSITHIFRTEQVTDFDVRKPGESSPHDGVASRRVACTVQVAAQTSELRQAGV